MTPQEIFDYKIKWMRDGAYSVRIHSDLESKSKDWCKNNLEQHQWAFQKYTGVYEHTFCFEKENDSKSFSEEFKDWVNL